MSSKSLRDNYDPSRFPLAFRDQIDVKFLGRGFGFIDRRPLWLEPQLIEIVQVQIAKRIGGPRGFWTDDKIMQLRDLLETQGLSAEQASAALGANGRNAVISAARRYKITFTGYGIKYQNKGFTGRQHVDKPQPKRPRSNVSVVAVRQRRALQQHPLRKRIDADVIKNFEAAIPLEQRVTLMQREDCHCHWPVGDGFYCGGKVTEKRNSWCAFHADAGHKTTYVGRPLLTG